MAVPVVWPVEVSVGPLATARVGTLTIQPGDNPISAVADFLRAVADEMDARAGLAVPPVPE